MSWEKYEKFEKYEHLFKITARYGLHSEQF